MEERHKKYEKSIPDPDRDVARQGACQRRFMGRNQTRSVPDVEGQQLAPESKRAPAFFWQRPATTILAGARMSPTAF
jgi:hypothetical protein